MVQAVVDLDMVLDMVVIVDMVVLVLVDMVDIVDMVVDLDMPLLMPGWPMVRGRGERKPPCQPSHPSLSGI